MTPLTYLRYEASISDHRAISAGFEMRIKKIVPEERERVRREVLRDWSEVERELLEMARSYYPLGRW